MKRLFAVLLCFILLQACTTTENSYVDPAGPASSMATLKGTMNSESLVVFTAFSVQAIDERNIPFSRRGTSYKFNLTPGKHKILVDGSFNTGWGSDCPCEARLVVSADFKAGSAYRLNGKVKDNRILAWIEEVTTSKRVSAVAEEPYVRSPRDTVYPVFIPV